MVKIPFPSEALVEGRFLERKNRFLAAVRVGSQLVLAHVPNSGRMGELLVPGAPVLLLPKEGAKRKTAFVLLLVKYQGFWVAIDSRLSNEMVKRALESAYFEQFSSYQTIKSEYAHGLSRFDFYLPENPPCLIEVKSVTLVEGNVAKFPDAPTKRGSKHLQELVQAKAQGYRCAVIFIIQRPDGQKFTPNWRTDPDFARNLRSAARAGVEVYAYRCQVEATAISLLDEVPVAL